MHIKSSRQVSLLQDLQWAPLVQRRQELRLALLCKIINGKVAIPVEDILTRADQRTRTNHPQTYRHLRSQSEQYRQSFFPRTVPEWNLLPESVVRSDITSTFLAQLRAMPSSLCWRRRGISMFNGTSTPKGSYSPKSGVNCTESPECCSCMAHV